LVRVEIRAVTEDDAARRPDRGGMTHLPPTQPPYKQLRRPTTDRMVAGVASGLGRYFNVDPTLVRVLFAVIVIFTGGLALLAYPVLWFLMPEEPPGAPAWPHPPAGGPVWPPSPPGTPVYPDPASAPTAPPAPPSQATPPGEASASGPGTSTSAGAPEAEPPRPTATATPAGPPTGPSQDG